MDFMDCFAKRPRGACAAIETGLNKNSCLGDEGCTFYQSRAEACASKNAALERIATLPDDVQAHIAEKYYKGKTPWMQMNGR